MALFALINTSSGSVPDDAKSLLEGKLGSRLTKLLVCDAKQLTNTIASFTPGPDDTIIVWGGDGTVAAALSASLETRAAILPLPGGTMNLLHKRVHGEAGPWQDLLETALLSPPIEMTYAEANGKPLYVALMLGEITKLA